MVMLGVPVKDRKPSAELINFMGIANVVMWYGGALGLLSIIVPMTGFRLAEIWTLRDGSCLAVLVNYYQTMPKLHTNYD